MKGVQCYELFGGIALKIHTFSHSFFSSVHDTIDDFVDIFMNHYNRCQPLKKFTT